MDRYLFNPRSETEDGTTALGFEEGRMPGGSPDRAYGSAAKSDFGLPLWGL